MAENVDAELAPAYPTIASIGYSIPCTGPATLVAWGYGYRIHSPEYVRIDHCVCSAADSHARPAFGNSYSACVRIPSQLAASHRKSGAAAQATSRTCSARNHHVL